MHRKTVIGKNPKNILPNIPLMVMNPMVQSIKKNHQLDKSQTKHEILSIYYQLVVSQNL